ncbi:MAG: BlaI/MecI/CopY family transcriptional regulator [Gemmatimonadales bacterium]
MWGGSDRGAASAAGTYACRVRKEVDIPSPTSDLGRREREIVEAVFRLKEASVADVRAELTDAPSYSAVRTMLGHLEGKGFVRHRRDGRRYLYSATQDLGEARRSVVRHVVDTFFRGSEEELVTMLLGRSELSLSASSLDRLRELIESLEAQESP